ncbi:hypothetical protein AJ80_09394 [Polytolypa hystricis UAMH7299]|uniref:Nuclear control of ATPase protein 2 n=1 Tax=Polytolypa hystricis (strain UAMH7299) TaxID=1447883 RepID=A0A2B7WRL7_POLH7|nr:hypothetical protein AJ80_09394 [Polytolypa hystricis UAMH7299]
MLLLADQICQLDIELDRLQLHAPESRELLNIEPPYSHNLPALSAISRAFRVTSSSRPLLKRDTLVDLLHRVHNLLSSEPSEHGSQDPYSATLEWNITAKATTQTLGLVVKTFLDDTRSLNASIRYWDQILRSYFYTLLYTIQTSPVRLTRSLQDAYGRFNERRLFIPQIHLESLSTRWNMFYDIVREAVKELSLTRARTQILSPFAICRTQARRKRESSKQLLATKACSIGILMEEGIPLDAEDRIGGKALMKPDELHEALRRTVILMQAILESSNNTKKELVDFEDNVFAAVDDSMDAVQQPPDIILRLIQILEDQLPRHRGAFNLEVKSCGRPHWILRYWLPGLTVLFSFGTALRVCTEKRGAMLMWAHNLYGTIIDFWGNWVVEPTKNLIGTIRHDENSEVALMSRASLRADQESLERMVVEFAIDRPIYDPDVEWNHLDIDIIKSKVKEGDLTPVLRAYERDLRKPFVGTVRGDLVRALLIQIQKTKVDVEIAIGGIDALLKSQELVFGLVGLTPGILVSYAALHWVTSVFGNRAGLRRGEKQGEIIRALRRVDRLLVSSTTPDGVLSYMDHGLLLCEVDILCHHALLVLPGAIFYEFKEDMRDLLQVRAGLARQRRVLKRIRFTYGKWIH